ncbi:uncharacterized protein LOC114719973 [Neltuma alba]|uniref:uncharacterized protein LOC114719973 n=1 Tax=Neltuma alba TaxID=207710 RepID=UPI0010A39381|nr:uncharacterized protein LOC114719973 [Prosopis alba]
MGSALEIGIRMRNMLTSLTKACYRFVRCHPCLVSFLGFLVILCRRFPFVVSILVYMSPVLVCTGVLLGTLLFFGQFNLAEVQKEKKFTDNVSSFHMGFSESATVISRRNEYKSITEERSIGEASLVKDKVNKADQNDGLLSLNVPVVDKNSLNIQPEKQVKDEMKREVLEEKLKAKGVTRNAEAIHGEEEEEEEASEQGSDDIESSSPDASMADIIPVLDELHPLLDMEGPQTAHSSRGGSGIEYEKSLKSDDGSVESDEGTEMPDYEEDEAEESGIEDESKSAIRWTEDDQKNLMDLGSLELERNQRLENIIARRRAWRQITEKNLIDLESTEVPSNVPPIVTRRNPFDLPDDSYDDSGLPPIPGSAPSILHPRKNPFDIPFDPNEEKPVPKGDSPKEEFPVFNQKDTFFRRHDSFSLGPSVLRMTKHERQDIYWKPIFVSEQMASQGTSYSSFLMQQSEVSDSKLSSIPETESASSTDQEERMSNEQDLPQEAESSGEVDSTEMTPEKQRNVHREEVEIVLGGVENNSETELSSETGDAVIHEEFNIGETHLRREVDEQSSSKSSRSSLSESD